LVGGAAASPAIRAVAPAVFGVPVVVPPAGEYVADGAARQAAWALTGTFPTWPLDGVAEEFDAPAAPHVRARHAEARTHWLARV
jgi:xylulokinase